MHSKPTLPNIVVGDMADTDSGTRRDTGNLDAWAVNAAYWDKTVGEGNDMYKELVLPAIEELAALDSTANECILDLATGTGIAASKLRACTGPNSHIVAADGCLEMLEIAKSRDRAFMDREMDGSIRGIEYVHLDLMDEKQLDSFTSRFGRCFDVISIIMAVLELPDLGPLATSVSKLLRPNTGRFIIINLHPAFSKPGAHRVIDVLENPNTGLQETRQWIRSNGYLSIGPRSSQGIRDQPVPQTLFHRPLQDMLSPFLKDGAMVLDSFKELAFQHEPDRAKIQSYHNFPQWPMLVALRLKCLK